MMKKWKILKSEYIVKNPYQSVKKEKCQLSNGIIIDEYYVNEYPEWVNAIVITNDKKIVFVKQYRHGARDFHVEAPAGKVEKDELFDVAITREVEEETGYTSLESPILLGKFIVNPATQNNYIHTYLIMNATKVSEQNLDHTEEIEVIEYDLDEVVKMVNDGKINHLFTSNALLLAIQYLNK